MGMCSPHELAQRQLTFVAFLLERWASKLEVSREAVPEGDGLPPLIADLASDRCPQRLDRAVQQAAEPRYLDTRKLAKSLRNRVGLLRKGESPAKLALGEDCVQPSCEQTLVFLYRQWCQAKPVPTQRRHVADTAQICNDLETIHHSVSGGAHTRMVQEKELTQKQRQELETLGRIRTTADEEQGSARGSALENWKIEDDSAQELRLVRPGGPARKRYAHGQLVAVRPSDAGGFILGQVRWLMGADNGDLHAGVKLMPGVPAATSVRAVGLNEKSDRAVPALVLGAVPALGSPTTLVLPSGWFKPKRLLEVLGERPAAVRLTEVIERGIDFERVAYEAV
jgi:cyclic-di-GMP-binding protein